MFEVLLSESNSSPPSARRVSSSPAEGGLLRRSSPSKTLSADKNILDYFFNMFSLDEEEQGRRTDAWEEDEDGDSPIVDRRTLDRVFPNAGNMLIIYSPQFAVIPEFMPPRNFLIVRHDTKRDILPLKVSDIIAGGYFITW